MSVISKNGTAVKTVVPFSVSEADLCYDVFKIADARMAIDDEKEYNHADQTIQQSSLLL